MAGAKRPAERDFLQADMGTPGRLKLHLDSAAEIIEAGAIFRIEPKGLAARILHKVELRQTPG